MQQQGAEQVELRGIYYGWWVVAALFVVLAVSSGLGFYALSVFLAAFTEERGFAVGVVSGATGCVFVVSGFWGLDSCIGMRARRLALVPRR